MLRLIFLTLAASCFLLSCTKTTLCHNAWGYGLLFYSSATDSVKDTSASVTEYVTYGNFSQPVRTITGIPFENYRYLPLSKYTGSADTLYKFDRIVTLYPSGKMYKMRNVGHNNRVVKADKGEEVDCLNDISYTVNDSSYYEHDPATSGHWYMYLPIKY